MRKSGLTGDEAYILSKHGKTTEDLGPLKKEIGLLKEDIDNLNDKKITKFYASNLGETHITDSDDGKIQDMMLYGRSEQKQYRGKNLLPTTMYSDSNVMNGITFINNGDGSVTVSGTATYITYFTLWGYNVLGDKGVLQGIAPGDVLYVSDCLLQQTNSKTIVSSVSNKSTQFYDSTTTMYVAIRVNEGETINKTFYPQIEKGSEATSYEPYTGGQPSPSPSYPQRIKSVVNPTVKIVGKNLINATLKTITMNGVTCINNGDGTYTLNGTPTVDTDFYIYGAYDTVNRIPLDSQKTYIVKKSGNSKIQFHVGKPGIYTTVAILEDGQIKNKSTISFFICRILSGTILNNFTIYPQVEEGFASTDFQPYHEQAITLPYTLNAIPVSSDGNITINGQQYIADYVNVERGKLVKMVDSSKLDNTQSIVNKTEWLLAEPQEIDLTTEEITAFKALATYYPTTNISVNSEQLDGYTVFNYPISMANGWNYVKQQIGDTRNYIYDMDARAQDTDLQSAEAYVNSEYAVALTELEV